jgi:large subunit ribosomal protein L17
MDGLICTWILGAEDFDLLTAYQTPHELLPKLFGPLRERYASRPGGYTRVLHVEPKEDDQAPSAILELVDGPKDMRFMMTARTLARLKKEDKEINEITQKNIEKVTRFRKDGNVVLENVVERMSKMGIMNNDRDAMEKAWARK